MVVHRLFLRCNLLTSSNSLDLMVTLLALFVKIHKFPNDCSVILSTRYQPPRPFYFYFDIIFVFFACVGPLRMSKIQRLTGNLVILERAERLARFRWVQADAINVISRNIQWKTKTYSPSHPPIAHTRSSSWIAILPFPGCCVLKTLQLFSGSADSSCKLFKSIARARTHDAPWDHNVRWGGRPTQSTQSGSF